MTIRKSARSVGHSVGLVTRIVKSWKTEVLIWRGIRGCSNRPLSRSDLQDHEYRIANVCLVLAHTREHHQGVVQPGDRHAIGAVYIHPFSHIGPSFHEASTPTVPGLCTFLCSLSFMICTILARSAVASNNPACLLSIRHLENGAIDRVCMRCFQLD